MLTESRQWYKDKGQSMNPYFSFFLSSSGWGKITLSGSSHTILQEAELPPVNNSECAKKLATSPGIN